MKSRKQAPSPGSSSPKKGRQTSTKGSLRAKIKYQRKDGSSGFLSVYHLPGSFISAELGGILSGKNYPLFYRSSVACVVDVGANVGAYSLFAGIHYPNARIIACEPSAAAFRLLQLNAALNPQIEIYQVGLYSKDIQAPLYKGKLDSIHASAIQNHQCTSEYELIMMRNAHVFLHEIGIKHIDILKIDTQGCEIPILDSLHLLLPSTKVIYIEYHCEQDRLSIDALLSATHQLHSSRSNLPHRGCLAYAQKSLNSSWDRLRIPTPALDHLPHLDTGHDL